MFTRITKFLFYTSIVIYLLACCTPYIHPQYFFAFSFLAIGFPLMLLVMLFWLLVFALAKSKKSLYILIIIACGYKNICSNTAFHFSKSNIGNKQNTFTLLSFNVCDFVNMYPKRTRTTAVKKYVAAIREYNTDIICLQDVDNKHKLDGKGLLNVLLDSLQATHPYFFYSKDVDTVIDSRVEQYGTCIISKFPITRSAQIKYSGNHFTESLGYANVVINKQAIRIYNTHFRSMYLKMPKQQKLSDFSYVVEDTNLVMHSNAFTKIKHYDTSHIAQAQLVQKVFDTTSIPFVFCGDINSTPSSYVYHTLTQNVNDAYLQNNFGWQETYTSKIPSMRIDVTLLHKKLKAVNYYSPRLKLSDHYPVITTVQLPH